jgi:probable phosphoglycerate mutase
MELLFVRHGEVEGIDPPRFRGRTELALTPKGRAEAAATGARIAAAWRVSQVLTSPMGRCVETGRAIASQCDAPQGVLEDLTDIDYGDWRWKTFEEVRRAEPEAFARWFLAPEQMRFPNGDSLHDLVARTSEALRQVRAMHPAATTVLVAHDSSIRAMLLQLLSMPLNAYWRLSQSPCGITQAWLENSGPRVVRMNETAHVEALAGAAAGGA